jgi:hypothetical protein
VPSETDSLFATLVAMTTQTEARDHCGRYKKTGFLSQRMTQEPGEFSNSVQLWDYVGYIETSVYDIRSRNQLGIQRTIPNLLPEIQIVILRIKNHVHLPLSSSCQKYYFSLIAG